MRGSPSLSDGREGYRRSPIVYEHDREARAISVELFDKLDGDRNGFLDRRELAKVSRMMSGGYGILQPRTLEGMLQSADQNKDGRVDQQEWNHFLRSVYEISGRREFLSVARDWSSRFLAEEAQLRDDQFLPKPAVPSFRGRRREPQPRANNHSSAIPRNSRSEGSLLRLVAPDERTPIGRRRRAPSDISSNASMSTTPAHEPSQASSVMQYPAKSPGEKDMPIWLRSEKTDANDVSEILDSNSKAGDESDPSPSLQQHNDGDDNVKVESVSLSEALRRRSSTGSSRFSLSEVTDEEERKELAALRIQAMRRENRARHASGVVKKKPHAEQPLVNAEELWDILTTRKGHICSSLEVTDFVAVFTQSQQCGLGMDLASLVPMSEDVFGNVPLRQQPPIDISAYEVAFLCQQVVDDADITEQEVRQFLDLERVGARSDGDFSSLIATMERNDVKLSLKQFKQLLDFFSALMQLDVQYIISQMSWCVTSRFEMPEKFEKLVKMHCACMYRPGETDEPFVLRHFVRMGYNTATISSSSPTGLAYEEAMRLFDNTLHRLPDLLNEHVTKLTSRGVKRACKRYDAPKETIESFIGRTEFQVFIEEFFEAISKYVKFESPLAMLLTMLRRVMERKPADGFHAR